MNNSRTLQSNPITAESIVMVKVITVLFITLIIVYQIPGDNMVQLLWMVMCVPPLLYAGAFILNRIFKLFARFHPLLPEHLELMTFLVFILYLVYIAGGATSAFKVIYILPIVYYSLKFGTKWGLTSASLSAAAVFFYQSISPERFGHNLEIDIVLACSFFLVSWVVGGMVDSERFLRARISEMAVRDELTGLYNYRYFHIYARELMDNSSKSTGEEKIGLVMIDLDNFKLYNEVMGNHAGDQLLKKVAVTINGTLGRDDFIARYSGDEFVIIVPAMDTAQVVGKAERIRKAISKQQSDIMGSDWRLSASLGIAVFPDHADSLEQLVQKADEALYKAKMTKGNRTQLFYSIFDRIGGKNKKISKEFMNTAKALLCVIQAKDRYTYGHSERVLVYAQLIARTMGLPLKEIANIEYAAILHDIGKIEIEREILNKPAALDEEEWAVMRRHPIWSAEIVKQVKEMAGILPAVKHHHERYDGTGYPNGLEGNKIPLGARIISVADAFDSITTERVYKKAKTTEKGLAILAECKGTQFDPLIVDVFIESMMNYRGLGDLLEWPRDLCRLVPIGYIQGCYLLGSHYMDFYTGDTHFMIKAVSYITAGIVNNEKCYYLLSPKKEKVLLDELDRFTYHNHKVKNALREGQLCKISGMEDLLSFIARRAKLEFETRKLFKTWMDDAYNNNYCSVRVVLDFSCLPVSRDEMITWEKNLTRCAKDLDMVIICLHDIENETLQTCRTLFNLHEKPLLMKEESADARKMD